MPRLATSGSKAEVLPDGPAVTVVLSGSMFSLVEMSSCGKASCRWAGVTVTTSVRLTRLTLVTR